MGIFIGNKQISASTPNALLEALNNKLDTNLSNLPITSDVIIEYKAPTTDDMSWYRVYKSGLIDQGGLADNGSAASNWELNITLYKPLKNTAYSVLTTMYDGDPGNDNKVLGSFNIYDKTTTGFKLTYAGNDNTQDTVRYAFWEVKGVGA